MKSLNLSSGQKKFERAYLSVGLFTVGHRTIVYGQGMHFFRHPGRAGMRLSDMAFVGLLAFPVSGLLKSSDQSFHKITV